jgi:arylsulfatase A-like enzyme
MNSWFPAPSHLLRRLIRRTSLWWIVVGLAAASVLVIWLAGRRRGPGRFDNLVLVTIDTLRADHTGLYGYPRDCAPFITRLGHEGVVFRRAVSSSSHTAPAHASLFTSLYPEQHQVLQNGQRLQPSVPTLASLCTAAGLDTGAFVSAGFLETLRAGFSHFDANDALTQPFRPADQTIRRVVDWLRGRERGRRFFLWVHLYDPHEHRPDAAIPGNLLKKMQADSAARGPGWLEYLKKEQGYVGTTVSERIDRYDAQVLAADSQLRVLLEELHRTSGRTLLIITADHGEGLLSHGYMGHGKHLYEEQIRVPLIFHDVSGRLRPSVVENLVRHVDLLPTAAELLGLPLDARQLRLEGRSLTALLADPRADLGVEAGFAQRRPAGKSQLKNEGWLPGQVLAARGPRYKYVFNEGGTDEFYDLAEDPLELKNLIDTPIAEKARLRDWLIARDDAFRADHRAPAPREIDPHHLEELRALGYF